MTKRRALLLVGCALLAIVTITLWQSRARATTMAELSQKVLDFCSQDTAKLQYDLALAHSAKPTIPVPPELDPPCQACGKSASPPPDASDQFVSSSMQPEANAIKDLLDIERQVELVKGVADQFSAPAQKCFAVFETTNYADAVSRLDKRLAYKAETMANTYKKNPKMAYAGVKFLLTVAHQIALIEGGEITSASGEEVLSTARTWFQTLLSTVDNDVFSQNKYNLCGGYLLLLKEMKSLGSEVGSAQAAQEIQKMEQFLHFNIVMDLHATGQNGGNIVDVAYHGEAKLALKLDSDKACYTPQIDPMSLAVHVDHWNVRNSKGTAAQLVSPHDFKADIGSVGLTLCGDNPKLEISFSDFGPQETVLVEGQTGPSTVYQSMMTAAIMNEVAANFNANSGARSANNAQMAQLESEIQAHKGDTSWLGGPQGQAAIAQLQQDAVGSATGSASLTGTGIVTRNVQVDWHNGTSQVVDKTFTLKKNGLDDELHVTVTQGS